MTCALDLEAPTHSALNVEAAMCLHEAMLDARMENSIPAVVDAFERIGTAGMRQHAVRLAPFVCAVTDDLGAAIQHFNYAHEVVPAVLATIQWPRNDMNGYALPTVHDAARDVVEALAQL